MNDKQKAKQVLMQVIEDLAETLPESAKGPFKANAYNAIAALEKQEVDK